MANSCIFASGAEEAQAISYLTLFRSLGSDATGTLNAWTTDNGVPSIAANVATLTSGSAMHAGHADWWDAIATVRFRWVTGATAVLYLHYVDSNNYTRIAADGTAVYLQKNVGGVFTTLAAPGAALVNTTFYWLRLTALGTSYTAQIFADSGGAIGAQIQTSGTFTITDSAVQTGVIRLESAGATTLFGGAFANVCTVTGPAPTGWVNNQGTGEPAWCWSKSKVYTGKYSFSIYNAHSSAQAWWQSPTFPTLAATVYTVACQALGLVGAAPANFYPNIAFSGPGGNIIADSAWHFDSRSSTPGAGNLTIDLIAYGVGTYYFDDVAAYVGTPSYASPVFSVPSDTRYGKRQVVKFGGLPVPIVGGSQSFIDIMDGANWFTDPRQPGVDIKIDRRLVSSPYVWRAKSVLQSEDYYPCIVTIPVLFDESNGNTFQAARAALFGAGSQYLTFDNLTGMVARLNAIQNMRMRVSAQPYLWEGQLQFVGYEPWWKDFAASNTDAKALSGSVSPGTATYFGIMQLGSIWTEPVFTLTIPVGNGVPISQFILLNSISGEQLSISFAPALAAATAWILTIDSGAMTVTDQNGKQYDFSGSFPLLYGPAQTVNSFTATLVTSSGVSTGVTLAASWTSRWVP